MRLEEANSRVELRASETVLYSVPLSSLEVPVAKFLRVVGTVALSSARSTTERVVI